MTQDQLRQALRELNGERDVLFTFADSGHAPANGGAASPTINPEASGGNASQCLVKRAMLVPAEEDTLVKVSDGKSIYIIDAQRILWIRIG